METQAQKIVVAKALRTSFNQIQRDVLKSTYMNDDYLIENIRRAQEENKLFQKLVAEIKEESLEDYEKHILGV